MAKTTRSEELKQKILNFDKYVKMEFKNEEAKTTWNELEKADTEDFYGNSVTKYARQWAKYMQVQIAEGKKVKEIAEQSSYDCDLGCITAVMYAKALGLLVKYWKYGEDLRKWHNSQCGYAVSTGKIRCAD